MTYLNSYLFHFFPPNYVPHPTLYEQGPECEGMYQNLPDHVNVSGEQVPLPAPSMIRSHSVSGDLHGVQPDPIAADILRKEPEQETFVRLKISPMGISSSPHLSHFY